MSKVHGELDELKDIMVKNIDNIAMRGERLELLVNKTENLSANVCKNMLYNLTLLIIEYYKIHFFILVRDIQKDK